MIDGTVLEGLERWFDGYVAGYRMDDPSDQRNLDIKVEHSRRVRREIRDLGGSVGLDEPGLRFADAAALLHDVGRFEQYARFRTFQDHRSLDHAAHGVAVLRAAGVLDGIGAEAGETLLRVIGNHNRLTVPDTEPEPCLRMSLLLRDADKLDIFRVVLEHHEETGEGSGGPVMHGLLDIPEISPDVAADIEAGVQVRMNRLRTVADFTLMNMGWIFDLNFPASFRTVAERGILDRLRTALPPVVGADRAVARVRRHLESMSSGGT
jgi:hypothetical protein